MRRIAPRCGNERRARNPLNFAVVLQRFFPGATRMGGIGRRAAFGYESGSRWSPSVLTRLGDAAARRNNEMRLR